MNRHQSKLHMGWPRPRMNRALAMLLLMLTVAACHSGGSTDGSSQTADSTTAAAPTEHRLSLLIAGDLMQHMPQIKAARQPDGSYDYQECFAGIKAEVEQADVAIANFETTLAGPPYSGYPQFSAPDDFLWGVLRAGFDVLLTANNHCVDTRRRGLERTLEMMDSLGVAHLGTYRTPEERSRNYPFLLEKNGVRIVLLNFTYDTNGLPVPKPCVVNLLDTLEIAADLEKARQMKPDAIIALPHWGEEYQPLPSTAQREMADWLLERGVTHIIGGHPHVAQPLELRDEGRHLVAWSMGNLVSNQSQPNTYGGYMVQLELTKRDSQTSLSDCHYTLYWVSRPPDCGYRHQHRILPIDHPDSLLTPTERTLRSSIRKNMRELMRQHGKGNIREKKMLRHSHKVIPAPCETPPGTDKTYFQDMKIYFHALVIYFQGLIIYFQGLKIICMPALRPFMYGNNDFPSHCDGFSLASMLQIHTFSRHGQSLPCKHLQTGRPTANYCKRNFLQHSTFCRTFAPTEQNDGTQKTTVKLIAHLKK